MAWLRPDKITEYNTPAHKRPPLCDADYESFMNMFVDGKNISVFSDKERETVKELILQPLAFSTGYPINASEKPRTGTVYITESGFREKSHYIGSGRLEGRSASYIVITGGTSGGNLNMAEPSLLLKMITILLWSGRKYFTARHLEEALINETPYEQDESKSHAYGIAMRSLTMEYQAEIHSLKTNYGVLEDG